MKTTIFYLVITIIIMVILFNIITYYHVFTLNTNTSVSKPNQVKTSLGKPLYPTKVQCNSKGNPDSKMNGELYKIYEDYHDIRKNNKISAQVPKVNYGGPNNIFIIRHAERVNSLYFLDKNGIYRSTYIPNIVEEINKRGYNIDFIIAPNPSLNNNHIHVQQTTSLTSWLLNIPLFIFGSDKEVINVATNLYKLPNFTGKNVLICWEHTCIQSLLTQILKQGSQAKHINNYEFKNPLGNSELPYWDKNNFNSIYHLDNNLQLHIWDEGINTCYPSNNKITFGKTQQCKGV